MNRIECCDNLSVLQKQPDEAVDLIYIDPPFNTGRSQRRNKHNARYRDSWPEGISGYIDFLAARLSHMHRVLKTSGTIYVHLDWHAVHYVKVLMDELFGYDNFLNEIIWHYRTGGLSRNWFGRKHDNILVYAKSKGWHTFHVQRDGQFRTDGLKKDEQGRPFKVTRQGRLYFHEQGPAVTDVWDIPFLSTVSLERSGWPSQKPLTLLRRIISASSNTRDVVADYFCGSGTTLLAAREQGRRYLGCDLQPEAVRIARARLKAQRKNTPQRRTRLGTKS